MSTFDKNRPSRRSVAVTGALGASGALAASTRALAGICPADMVGVDVMKPGAGAIVGESFRECDDQLRVKWAAP